jgi:hypothetical protein
MPLLSLTQNTTVLSLVEAITLTETKAEQLMDFSATQRIPLLAMTTNDYWSKPLQTLIHTIKTNGSFLLFLHSSCDNKT